MRGQPRSIRVDNGPEFISQVLDAWAFQRGLALHFIRPGKPIGNAHAESFNARFRDECLSEHWFTGFADAREKIELWRKPIEYFKQCAGLA